MKKNRVTTNKKVKVKKWRCKECGGTVWRYLDCDDCREKGKQCINVCCNCGAEVSGGGINEH